METDNPWKLGSGNAVIAIDKYLSGSGPYTVYYKTGSTSENCEVDSWHEGTSLTSLGWIMVRIEA